MQTISKASLNVVVEREGHARLSGGDHRRGAVERPKRFLPRTHPLLIISKCKMNIYTLLRRLPYTLIITSLALAAAVPAESVELKVLTPDDFDQTIAKGVW